MADPLSIIASAIAIGQAAEGLVGLLSKLKDFRQAPREVEHLHSEVAQAKKLLLELQATLVTIHSRNSTLDLSLLQGLLYRHAGFLQQIESLIQRYLIRPEFKDHGDGDLCIRRFGWVINKNKIESLRSRLKESRELVSGELSRIAL